ncbi:MAG: hypothetical protein KJ709_05060 [Nanoarchaeota archaeon]|nr:hypothetical protein [Nanoarchaeota archaeon]
MTYKTPLETALTRELQRVGHPFVSRRLYQQADINQAQFPIGDPADLGVRDRFSNPSEIIVETRTGTQGKIAVEYEVEPSRQNMDLLRGITPDDYEDAISGILRERSFFSENVIVLDYSADISCIVSAVFFWDGGMFNDKHKDVPAYFFKGIDSIEDADLLAERIADYIAKHRARKH